MVLIRIENARKYNQRKKKKADEVMALDKLCKTIKSDIGYLYDEELSSLRRAIKNSRYAGEMSDKKREMIGNILERRKFKYMIGEVSEDIELYVYKKYNQEIYEDPLLTYDPELIEDGVLSWLSENMCELWPYIKGTHVLSVERRRQNSGYRMMLEEDDGRWAKLLLEVYGISPSGKTLLLLSPILKRV